jgi:hypothetical protein
MRPCLSAVCLEAGRGAASLTDSAASATRPYPIFRTRGVLQFTTEGRPGVAFRDRVAGRAGTTEVGPSLPAIIMLPARALPHALSGRRYGNTCTPLATPSVHCLAC